MDAKEFITKFDNKEGFTEDELKGIAYYGMNGIDNSWEKEGASYRWERAITTIIQIGNRYFAIPWMRGLTECQEDSFYDKPYEVKPVKKTIVVTEYVAVEQ
jgi:hypothetical protein